jgi:SPX domain protein involved in polyphosphate accumulation
MGTRRSGFERYELKYHISRTLMPDIRSIIEPHVRFDSHCADLPGNQYTVRSIYFDSEELDFYFDKLDSVRVRKKLRVRTYNLASEAAPAFLEIKRKIGRRGLKERLMLDLQRVDPALSDEDAETVLPGITFLDRKVLDKFRFNLINRDMRPVVLVTYEREAYIGRENERYRVTFDQNIRSLINPRLDQIFEENELRVFEEDNFVLEMKFDERMPRWMTRVVRRLNLRSESYSKYVHGIDAWTPHPH